jgi:hypothetical protein
MRLFSNPKLSNFHFEVHPGAEVIVCLTQYAVRVQNSGANNGLCSNLCHLVGYKGDITWIAGRVGQSDCAAIIPGICNRNFQGLYHGASGAVATSIGSV